MRSTTTVYLAAAFLTLSLLGCHHNPPPPPPAAALVSHISVSPNGHATQLAGNGTELVWDLNAAGFKSYVIQFQGVGPCGPALNFYGVPGKPAHCTVKGQVNVSSYKYIILVEYPDLPSTTPSAIQPKAIPGGGPPTGDRPFRVVGCNSCPPNVITGVDSTDGAPGGNDLTPPDPLIGGASGGSKTGTSPGDTNPDEIDYSCMGRQATVTQSVTLPQNDLAFWQSFGGAGSPAITFQGASPCSAQPQAPDFSCFLIGNPGTYNYTLAVPPVATPNPPVSCPVPANGTITVTATAAPAPRAR